MEMKVLADARAAVAALVSPFAFSAR